MKINALGAILLPLGWCMALPCFTQSTIRNDPQWLTYSGLSMEAALEQNSPVDNLTGSLPSADGYYFMNLNSGGDLGGISYIFHTGPLNGQPNTADLGPSYPIDFGLRYMNASNSLLELRYLPVLISEIYTPVAPTTFVLSNEAPGYLIDNLIAAGHGSSSLYDVIVSLKPASGGVISQEFLDKLASCSAGSEVKTVDLSNFAGLNNPICANADGTLRINPIFGKDYFGKPGYTTYPEDGSELFTYATGPEYYIDAGYAGNGTRYEAFAIAWSNSTTPKAITITADSGQSKAFGEEDPVFTYTFQPALDAGDSFTGALSREPGEAPGTYAITAGTLSAGAKYAITFVSAHFTINQVVVVPTTFVLSNEAPGKLIDRLIAAGHGNSSLYEVMVALKPASGGVLTDEFLSKLATCPVGSEIFTATLSDVAPPGNNPIGINTDGTLIIVPIYGADYFQREGWDTYTGNQPGIGIELFTFAESPLYYIDAGTSQTPGVTAHYQAFAIAWSNSTDGIPDIGLKQDTPRVYPNPFSNGLYIMDLNGPARVEVYNMLGELLIQIKTAKDGFISLKNLSNGVYWLRISSTNSVTRQKIVKNQ